MPLLQAVEEWADKALGGSVVCEFGAAEPVHLVPLETQFAVFGHHLGVPARYVGGYFHRADGVTQQEAGHAWAEAHVPSVGWIAFDPANGICATDSHVRVAVGLDYLGAAPVRGTRYGGGAERLAVAVHVDQAARQMQS